MMIESRVGLDKVLRILILLSFNFAYVRNIDDKCDDNMFLLVSKKHAFLLDFDLAQDLPLSIIYQAKNNTTIENGLFNKRTNTIILLINQADEIYSLILLNIYDNKYNNWIQKSNKLSYSTYVYISVGHRYLYVLNYQSGLLQTFYLPLTLKPNKQNYLTNLPTSHKLLNYVIDENIHLLWILIEYSQIQLYQCQLETYDCQLHLNLFYIAQPVKLSLNSFYQHLYIYSNEYLIEYQYNANQTDYTIHRLNFTQQKQDYFVTLCEKSNHPEQISIEYSNEQQVCLQTCQSLSTVSNDTSHIHSVQRISILSDIHRCSKQRKTSKIVVLVLILTDIVGVLGVIMWLTYKYLHQPTIDKVEKPPMDETIWTSETGFITRF